MFYLRALNERLSICLSRFGNINRSLYSSPMAAPRDSTQGQVCSLPLVERLLVSLRIVSMGEGDAIGGCLSYPPQQGKICRMRARSSFLLLRHPHHLPSARRQFLAYPPTRTYFYFSTCLCNKNLLEV